MSRPVHLSDADRADDQKRQTKHDDLMNELSEREAQMKQGLTNAYDELDLDVAPPACSAPRPRPTQQTAPLAHTTAPRRSRRRH